MWQEMARIGKKLVDHGLVESHFGNISVRQGNSMVITRSGCPLDEICEENVVEVPIHNTCEFDGLASSETRVHRRIYQETDAGCIVHGHCPFAVVMSLLDESGSIEPLDSEGVYFLGHVSIVEGSIGSEELAANSAAALAETNGVIVKSHGTISTGKTLDHAYINTTQIEHTCKVRYYYDLAKRSL
ncbi:aldolase [Methanohalophilus mahii]|nr:aldolase [Methanohalophilus mahii]